LSGNGLMVLFSHTFWPFGELMSIPHPLSSLELYHAAVCGNHAKENLALNKNLKNCAYYAAF
jgi:hypothetical protein